MADTRLIYDVLKELHAAKKIGALYVDMVEASEDMLKIYIEDGNVYAVKYGSAVGNDCLDILEYYNLYSCTFFEGITAPKSALSVLPSEAIFRKFQELKKTVKLR